MLRSNEYKWDKFQLDFQNITSLEKGLRFDHIIYVITGLFPNSMCMKLPAFTIPRKNFCLVHSLRDGGLVFVSSGHVHK